MDTEELKITPQKRIMDNCDTLEDIILSECSPIIKKYNIDDNAIKEIITKAIVPAQEFSRKLWQLYNETMSNCPDIFQVVDAELFLRVIKHIRSVVYQKIENRNVGISIVIYSKEDDISNSNSDYDMQASISRDKEINDTKDYFDDLHNELKRAYKGIDSHKAFFAFVYNKAAKTIVFKGIRTFNSASIEQICLDNQVGFNVSEGVPCIRIYTKGNHILDYIINESTGDWMIRIKENIKEIIGKQINLNPKDLVIITEIVLQLSYLRIGAMLIITSERDNFINNPSTYELKSFYLEENYHSGLIYQYAANDGVVIIQYEQGKRLKIYKIGVILNPTGDMYEKSTYKSLVESNNCGSRHEKAARYACEHPSDCIIVVSENRSISILHGPEPIYWRDDPNPLKK